jgi:hypothetical protein
MDFELVVVFHARPADDQEATGVRWLVFASEAVPWAGGHCASEADFLDLPLAQQKSFKSAAERAFAARVRRRAESTSDEPLCLKAAVYCAGRGCSTRLFGPGEATLTAVARHPHVLNNSTLSVHPWSVHWRRLLVCANPVCSEDGKVQLVVALRALRDANRADTTRDALPLHYLRACARCCATDAPDAPFQRCGRCKISAYCSQACQTAHWPLHRPVCYPLHAAPPVQHETNML